MYCGKLWKLRLSIPTVICQNQQVFIYTIKKLKVWYLLSKRTVPLKYGCYIEQVYTKYCTVVTITFPAGNVITKESPRETVVHCYYIVVRTKRTIIQFSSSGKWSSSDCNGLASLSFFVPRKHVQTYYAGCTHNQWKLETLHMCLLLKIKLVFWVFPLSGKISSYMLK